MYFQEIPECSTQFLDLVSCNRNELEQSGLLRNYVFQRVPESSTQFLKFVSFSRNELEYSSLFGDYVNVLSFIVILILILGFAPVLGLC